MILSSRPRSTQNVLITSVCLSIRHVHSPERATCNGHYVTNWRETNSKTACISEQIKIARMFTPVGYTTQKTTKRK
jgi:hypothetical protein